MGTQLQCDLHIGGRREGGRECGGCLFIYSCSVTHISEGGGREGGGREGGSVEVVYLFTVAV